MTVTRPKMPVSYLTSSNTNVISPHFLDSRSKEEATPQRQHNDKFGFTAYHTRIRFGALTGSSGHGKKHYCHEPALHLGVIYSDGYRDAGNKTFMVREPAKSKFFCYSVVRISSEYILLGRVVVGARRLNALSSRTPQQCYVLAITS